MTKNEMRTTRIAIMIIFMLGFAQAYPNPLSMKTESRNKPDELSCSAKCGIDCVLANLFYLLCYAICVSKCHKTPTDIVSNCLSGCGLTKPIYVKSPGALDIAIHRVDSCLQECQRK
uniref:Thionin-like protein 2 n=1 Tax=Cajanus cajan TaxID=3821 RepID=A0A151RK24_CAJCA|nr:hypothetical protein KK1_035787 [Cajanus cajan]